MCDHKWRSLDSSFSGRSTLVRCNGCATVLLLNVEPSALSVRVVAEGDPLVLPTDMLKFVLGVLEQVVGRKSVRDRWPKKEARPGR